ncbi:energy-coupling factor transporter transmembrane protein EcfT [Cellulomonas sp. DKR-3]|uniref:Energy-coupling factor transporter transmembrane protein EcfT n=1 Tax=Cellulomonas fulva TaxID=2835530 RepID=A0ABS5U016_9CELL|nr:energy-coupling factor transporter transmembrane component T [Cellulomonas fulva]MBT0994711.1 energy-coupling factor transporter transmembrane protein EcfT [Cellulomonas fulva]
MSGAPRFGRALEHDSVLHRRNPTVKLVVLLVVSTVLLVPVDVATPLLVGLLLVPAGAAAGRLPVRTLTRAALAFAPFALSILAVNAVTRDGPVVARVAGMEVTGTGLTVGTSLALRTLVVGLLAFVLTATTDGPRLMTSLHQHARLPAHVTYAVLAGYRVLEGLPEAWTTIRRAQAVRDPGRRRGAPLPRDPASLARAAFALLVGALRQGERLATSLQLRGLGSGPRTVHRPVPLGPADAVLAASALGTCALVVLVTWRLGWLLTWGTLAG